MVQFTNFSGRLGTGLASFPGSRARVEKKTLVHTVCASSVPFTRAKRLDLQTVLEDEHHDIIPATDLETDNILDSTY